MGLKDNWLERQISTVKELMEEGSALIEENKLVKAEARLKEAAIIIESAETLTPQVLNMRSMVYNELGILSSRTRDPEGAISYHRLSLEARQKLQEVVKEELRPAVAASHLNLGSLLTATRAFDEAERQLKAAFDLLEEFMESEDTQIHSLLLGAYQNMGIVQASKENFEKGIEYLTKGTEVAQRLVEDGQENARSSLAQMFMNLAVTHHANDDSEKAVEVGEKASELVMELYNADLEDTSLLHQYLNCQLNLIAFNEAIKKFDAAENALFRILELQPGHPDIIKRGKAFYNDILGMSDFELVQGGLPREEAEESLAELEAMED